MVLIGTVTDGNGLKVEVYATEVSGGVQFTVKVVEGFADLRGFFLDVGDSTSGLSVDYSGASKIGNESVTSAGGKDNNMNGSGETFDVGIEIGTAGIGKDDISEVTFTVQGITLDQLDELSFGVRATSVGESREDSVKLVGTFDIPEDEPQDDFPVWAQDISHTVLYFDTNAGDRAQDGTGHADTNDGVYTVKIDEWDGSRDLDDSIDAIVEWLVTNDPVVTEDTVLLGAHIKGGVQATQYYAYGDGNLNGTDPDSSPTGALVEGRAIDTSYDYDTVFA
jgi:hypothetical protein